jgi:hypothetical protein
MTAKQDEDVPPAIEINPNETVVELDLGSTFYAQCRVIGGDPAPIIEWRRKDGNSLSNRVSIFYEGIMIQLRDIEKEDSGIYECVAKNSAGEAIGHIEIIVRANNEQAQATAEINEKPQEQQAQIQEQEKEREQHPPPQVIIEQPHVEGKVGSTVRLGCKSNSEIPVRFEWTDQQYQPLTSEPDGTLVLNDLKENSTGYYICTISNYYGSSRGFVLVNVIEEQQQEEIKPDHEQQQQQQQQQNQDTQTQSSESNIQLSTEKTTQLADQKPEVTQKQIKVTIDPKSPSANPGESIELKCKLDPEDSNLAFKWTKDNSDQLPLSSTINGNALRFENLKLEDAGSYQCSVIDINNNNNVLGFNSAILEIKKSQIEETTQTSLVEKVTPATEQISNKYGSKLSVDCGEPNVNTNKITWTKLGGFNRAKFESQENGVSKMTINSVKPMDFGTYVCQIVKSDGTIAKKYVVIKRDPDYSNQFKIEINEDKL